MRIAVLKESHAGELRVGADPKAVQGYVKKGVEVFIEAGAGAGAQFLDEAYAAAGAQIVKKIDKSILQSADVVLCVRFPDEGVISNLNPNSLLIGLLDPYGDKARFTKLAELGVTAFAMELIPRITRAQSMDVLSSQANLAGYKAVVDASSSLARAFPMMMTAAGTVVPVKLFVMGAGVAGLQAIATARRLGAVVSATDVRAAAGEQVASLGAKFVFVEGMKDAVSEGGYARELTTEEKQQQADLVANHVKSQDVVITTALIPGRPAPVLITKAMVESMKPGSLIVDLAASNGGNCELSKPGKDVVHKGVTIRGAVDIASQLAENASALYARNLSHFMDLITSKEGSIALDWEDEILKACAVVRDGNVK